MPPEAQLFLILLVVVFFWFVVLRPARSQQRRVQELQRGLEIGSEVVLSSGIFGTIRSLEETRVRLEVAPGTELTVARQAVVRRVEAEPEPETDLTTADEQPDRPGEERG